MAVKGSTFKKRTALEDKTFDGWDHLDEMIIWGTQEYCAEKLGISVDSLARRLNEIGTHFAEYKNKRREGIRVSLMQKQYEVAMQGNVSMLIWLGKQYLGQTDKQETETNTKLESIEEYLKKIKEQTDKQ
jgi:hypothetical protein